MIQNKILQTWVLLYIPDIERYQNKFNRVPVYSIGLNPTSIFKDMYNFDGDMRRHSYCIRNREDDDEVPIYA